MPDDSKQDPGTHKDKGDRATRAFNESVEAGNVNKGQLINNSKPNGKANQAGNQKPDRKQ